jgi:2-polyprenyl-3-methyl-5-hydroxy-6-metoxy-1,4-benzoquinol methylase
MTIAVASPFPPMACPFDRQPLAASDADNALACTAGHGFTIRNGIPRLLASEQSYADAFGTQWQEYRITQLDSVTKTTISKDRLRRCVGEVLWKQLQQPAALQVLEAGCGAGRFTEILLQQPAARITSTDLSSAVEPNQANCPQSDRHRIIQCDINRFPFLPEQYDVVLCLGVVQHTRDPELTISDLYQQVRPGGALVFDHYTHSLSIYTKVTAALLRPILKRVSPERGVRATRALTRWFFPLHRAVRNHRYLQYLLSRVSPLLTYYHAFPELNDRQQYEWAELDTHDSLTDYYKWLRSCRSIRRTLEKLGAEGIEVATGGNGVEARCRKPRR